jgi:hypothetical protein
MPDFARIGLPVLTEVGAQYERRLRLKQGPQILSEKGESTAPMATRRPA